MPEASRAATLRRAFDHTFTEPVHGTVDDAEGFLAIRVGADAYAIRVGEVGGLFVDKKVIRLRSPMPEFLGLVGIRGVVVPVYSLRGLLGYPVTSDIPRWLVVGGAHRALGLSFDEVEGYLRIRPSGLFPSRDPDARIHVAEAVSSGGLLRGVVGIRSIVEGVRRRTDALRPTKEQ